MRRHALSALVVPLLALAAGGADATLIDSFETGAFSLSLSAFGDDMSSQNPDPAHCIASQRDVYINYFEATGTMTSQLLPSQGVDDALVTTFPNGTGYLLFEYLGGPWDLTEGGTLNRLSIRVTGGGGDTDLFVRLDVDGPASERRASLSGTGTYHFALSDFSVDPTQVTGVRIRVSCTTGETVGIQNIDTSSGSTVTLLYQAWTPTTYSWLCGPARGGSAAVGWDWAIGWPAQPNLAGSELQIDGVSGAGCAGVEFEAGDSGGGGYGEVGLVTVDWLASTFDNGLFELRFFTDPDAGYVVQPLGDPVVEVFGTGFRIVNEITVEDVFGIPDGTVRQELIVAPAPGQEIYLDYVDAFPVGGGSAVGYSLSFGYTGAVFDPGQPLLEIYTSGNYGDDAGATGVDLFTPADLGSALTARPSVTRTETRFVLAGEPAGPATVDVFDVTGRLVRRLETRHGEATWDATNDSGARVPAGVYFGRATGSAKAARVTVLR